MSPHRSTPTGLWRSVDTRGPLRRAAVFLVAGAALGAVVGWLLLENYRAVTQRRSDLLREHAAALVLRAAVLGNVLDNAEGSLRAVGDSPEVSAMLESLELGMSEQYGLALSRAAIRDRLRSVIRRGQSGTEPAFSHVALLDRDGTEVAGVGPAGDVSGISWPPSDEEADGIRLTPDATRLASLHQVTRGGKPAGALVGWLTPDPVTRTLVQEYGRSGTPSHTFLVDAAALPFRAPGLHHAAPLPESAHSIPTDGVAIPVEEDARRGLPHPGGPSGGSGKAPLPRRRPPVRRVLPERPLRVFLRQPDGRGGARPGRRGPGGGDQRARARPPHPPGGIERAGAGGGGEDRGAGAGGRRAPAGRAIPGGAGQRARAERRRGGHRGHVVARLPRERGLRADHRAGRLRRQRADAARGVRPGCGHHARGARILLASIREGRHWRGVLAGARADGRPFDARVSVAPVRMRPEPRPTTVLTARDVTDELREQERRRHAQKLEAIGALAGGVAHDFNNLLTAINGYAAVALEDLRPGDPLREDIEEIRDAGARAADLTRQLLAFGRRQVLNPESLDPNGVVGGIEKMLGRVIGEQVDLITDLQPDVWRIRADRGQRSRCSSTSR